MSKIKFFCLPHAGGSASVYLPWSKTITHNVEFKPIEYPGRGYLAKEHLCSTINEIVDAVFETIISMLDKDEEYVIYGHSMGSLVTYELTYKLMENGFKKPLHLILSGGKAPQRRTKKKDGHALPLDEFEEFVSQYGGKQIDMIFQNEELKNYFIPILRSDIKIVEEYIYQPPEYLLNTNISILIGEDDESTSWEDIKEWSDITTGECQFYYFKGGHFFVQEYKSDVLKEINNIIDSITEYSY
ncbi:thioesterase II family protein [Pseudalkalibacillus sp. SCS-8]|uniref:thioesterase II family protein n=1 Tax=Pseudalkalibacillus nanhaiensis TaxID=3115291 RepID=UPI0032DA23E4